MEIIRGRIPGAKKTVVYGPEGIGKSTFASRFPDPVFIDTEGSTKDMDVARFPKASSWTMLLEQVKDIKQNRDICQTLVIDTADWAEVLCITHILSKYQQTSIEGFGYGKGYVYVQEEFGRLLNLLEEVVETGVHVVLTAHAKMRKFEQPDEMGAYDRWEMKLSKGVAPIVKEWADIVLFANYKVLVYNVDGQGAQKGKNKAQGGKRVMYTTHHPCWDAKNRYGLSDELPFAYKEIAHVIESKKEGGRKEPVRESGPGPSEMTLEMKTQAKSETTTMPAGGIPDGTQEPPLPEELLNPPPKDTFTPEGDSKNIPRELRELMVKNQVHEWDIQAVVAKRGYFPMDMPIQDYPADFIQGVLVGAWDKVFQMIREMKEASQKENPFK